MNRLYSVGLYLFVVAASIDLHGPREVSGDDAATTPYFLAIAVAQEKTVYLADRNLPGVWRLSEGKLSPWFTGSRKLRTPLNAVRCLAIDAQGGLLAGDSATRDVYRFDEAGKPTPLTGGGIGIPMAIGVNAAGELLVADLELHKIWKVPAAGGKPEPYAQVPAPRGLYVDADDRVWVVSHGKDQLVRLTEEGKIETVVSGRPFQFPSAVVVDKEGVAFVCDTYAKAIWKVVPGEAPAKLCEGAPLVSPVGLAWQGSELLVADPRANAVFRVDSEGKIEPIKMAVEPK